MRRIEASDLASAFAVGCGDLVTLVGGGGKTTLMYRLTRELFGRGVRAAAATTTKIAQPGPEDFAVLFCASTYDELRERLAAPAGPLPPVIGERVLESGKVQGIPRGWCDRLLAEGVLESLVVEADGAARKPLKAPEAWEPVVPSGTTLFVEVCGLSCLGRPLDEATVFRSALAAAVAEVPPGSPITEEVVARLLLSPAGLRKGKPGGARWAVLMNQADSARDRARGERIAEALLGREPACDRVVIATLRAPEPIRDVWLR